MEPRPPPAPRGGGGDPSHPLPPPPRAHVPHAPLPGAPRGRPVAFRQRAVPRGPLPPPEPELADADADADDAPEGGGEGGGQAAEAVAAAHLRGVHALLWRQRLAPLVPPAERAEVIRALGGESVLRASEGLWDECEALASILGECDARVEHEGLARRTLYHPAREMVEGEVRQLVRAIQAQHAGDGAGATASVKEKQMLEYVMSKDMLAARPSTACGSRPGSSRSSRSGGGGSRPGTAASGLSRGGSFLSESASRGSTPDILILGGSGSQGGSHGGSRGGTARSDRAASSLSGVSVDSLCGGKLGVDDIASMAAALRAALEEEHEALEEDVATLTEALEASTDALSATAAEPPPLDELRQYGARLQDQVREEEARRETAARLAEIERRVAEADLADAAAAAGEGACGTPRATRPGARRLRSLVLEARDTH